MLMNNSDNIESGNMSSDSETVVNAEMKSMKAVGVPPGNYRLVGWDMDVTGRKVIDEMCHIAAYTPKNTYSQYVMPYKNLTPPAIKKHNMKIVTVSKYRLLKDSKTNKFLKTKSKVSALTEFLMWLESVRGDATDGVILVYHEPRKVIVPMLLESLITYNLLDRFKNTVVGFVNGFNVARDKCSDDVGTYSLRTLSKTLLKKQRESLDNASNRACLSMEIIQHLTLLEMKTDESTNPEMNEIDMTKIVEFVRDYVQPVEMEEKEHGDLKAVYEREESLGIIFRPFYRAVRKERQQTSPLRRLLAEAGIGYAQLQDAWISGNKDGLEAFIRDKLSTAEPKKVDDLVRLLECHFDPDKKLDMATEQDKSVTKKEMKISDDKENNNKYDSGNESPNVTIDSSIKSEPELTVGFTKLTVDA